MTLVSAADFVHLDEDLPPITAALRARGIESAIADWHDPHFDWDATDLAIVRSTWDYTWQLDDFLAWAGKVSTRTRLANPVDVIEWNTDKRYLGELGGAGAPVVPTLIVEPGDAASLTSTDDAITELIERTGASEIVVKPVVSAGGRDTERHPTRPLKAAQAHIESLLGSGRAAIVQPYLNEIEKADETGLVYVGDEFSHAFKKGAMLGVPATFVEGHYREERIRPCEPADQERQVAEDVLDAIAACIPKTRRGDLLYARVDLAPDRDGTPLLVELELTEPSLFCSVAPGAAERFADAVVAALG